LIFNSLVHIIFFETLILTETFTFFLISLLFYLLLKNKFENSTLKQDLVLSFLLGFLTLVKPFYVFFPFLIFIAYLFNNLNLKKIISRKLVLFIFPLFTFFGWSYINKMNTGYFTSSTLFGFNIAQNCVYFAENTSPEFHKIGLIYAKYRDKNIRENKNVEMSIWDAHLEL
jgi:4-amino-4-deoxy-L-arabinose transferase-like glycosyltransferase